MPRNLRSNSTEPAIYPLANPIPNKPELNMAAEVPTAPAVVWTENLLTGNFDPGTVAGQKIFLENTKGLATLEQLPLMNSTTMKIVEFF